MGEESKRIFGFPKWIENPNFEKRGKLEGSVWLRALTGILLNREILKFLVILNYIYPIYRFSLKKLLHPPFFIFKYPNYYFYYFFKVSHFEI